MGAKKPRDRGNRRGRKRKPRKAPPRSRDASRQASVSAASRHSYRSAHPSRPPAIIRRISMTVATLAVTPWDAVPYLRNAGFYRRVKFYTMITPQGFYVNLRRLYIYAPFFGAYDPTDPNVIAIWTFRAPISHIKAPPRAADDTLLGERWRIRSDGRGRETRS